MFFSPDWLDFNSFALQRAHFIIPLLSALRAGASKLSARKAVASKQKWKYEKEEGEEEDGGIEIQGEDSFVQIIIGGARRLINPLRSRDSTLLI